jgi:crotonobetainyl-CoA:carnitine CoA-transferase CaiB-like acyl-CoA transferase
MSENKKILRGIRVLDFTDALSGPFCARYLADCGCEVINVERPEGKIARSLPYFKDGYCAEYIQNHCGKKSIAVDLKAPGAHDLIMDFVRVSDVVLENFRPGVMAEFGLDYAALKVVNPSIIMCSISGWGQTGPMAKFMGIDVLIQSLRGLANMSSLPGERPVFFSFAVSDILAGLNGFGAICAALYRRAITGEGEYIDIGMADCALAALGNAVGAHVLSKGQDEFRYMAGSFSPDLAPAGVYKGRDGYVTLYTRSDDGWERLTEAMGKPELAKDPRFLTRADRLKNREELTEVIEEWVQGYEKVSDVATLIQSYRINSATVAKLSYVIDEDPQTKERGMIVEMPHPTLGTFKYLNTPLRFQNSEAGVDEPPPVAVGEHTEAILRSVLKLDKKAIQKLRKDKVVFGSEG